ncbi:MAG TPA: hypothetical protein VHD83_29115 [Puia sp.]|nr:hypothetical protein [Puia sp.]
MRRSFLFILLVGRLLPVMGQTSAARAGRVVEWPAGEHRMGRLVLSMAADSGLIRSLSVVRNGVVRNVLRDADPTFLLRVGRRDLISQNGWNIFFDKVPAKGYKSYEVRLEKKNISVTRSDVRTVVAVDGVSAPGFTGRIEITLYHGSLLMNIAAVVTTQQDSTAILYDAGLVSRGARWDSVGWCGVDGRLRVHAGGATAGQPGGAEDSAHPEAVKYRAIAVRSGSANAAKEASMGSLVVFPAPHQYFYPLDEAFNLRFVWWSSHGLGIRQEPEGDHRFVPWFNAPPGTEQRLNFFCLPGDQDLAGVMDAVKAYTRGDHYKPLPGYKTFSSHFHNEYITKVVLAGKPVPERTGGSLSGTAGPDQGGPRRSRSDEGLQTLDTPEFVRYFKEAGIDIVHLAEFHGVGHPKGPDEQRLKELDALFRQCRRLSDRRFLLLPGEEPNEFFGGHWLAFFPHPVYWIMSHRQGDAFITEDPMRGKVYHVGSAAEMIDLLQREQGLGWTAHPRTKGSTGYPDAYRGAPFFRSEYWLGGAWKALPADLSQPRLGRRVLDLLDDMNNWGLDKRVLAEADLFTIDRANEMYGHMNVNYLKMGALPAFDKGWGAVLDTLRRGRFFSTTGEVLIPSFSVNGGEPGDVVTAGRGKAVRVNGSGGQANVSFRVEWTFPLNFAELVSGDGEKVYRQRIDLSSNRSFGVQTFVIPADLSGRKWVRLEVWDVAADGAFSQTVRLR